MPTVLVDAGPLVALIDRSDPYHRVCRETLATIRDPLGTVWPAFTEAMYLLRQSAQAQRALWDLLNVGGVRLLDLDHEDCPRMRELMWKYRVLPMDLADAALVRVAERERLRRVFTIDRQDFEVYRPYRLGRFEILP
jgi:predicted nucleic acid-binding protein